MAKRPSVTEQARRLTNGQINRRRFIMSAVASGVTLPTATALATKAEARAPRRGGTLRIATAQSAERFVAGATGNTLTQWTSDGRITGELATSLKASSDRRLWTVALRADVLFHDGTALSAPQVAAWLQTTWLGGAIIEPLDAHTLQFKLHHPEANFAARLAEPGSVVRNPETGAATGGYVISHRNHDRTHLVRNTAYWKSGAAHFDAVEIHTVADAAERHRAVMTGEVDYADEIDPQAVATLKGLPTLDVLETEGTHHLGFPMRHDVPPFDDKRVRTALGKAIDGQAVLRRIAIGHGRTVAGSSDGMHAGGALPPITLHVSEEAVPGSQAAAKLIAEQAGENGISVSIANHQASDWTEARDRAGWYVAKGPGLPASDAVPGFSLNALAAHSSRLSHPVGISAVTENDGFRIAERWWFDDLG